MLLTELPFSSSNDTAPTTIYTLSLHDALPISRTEGAAPARLSWADVTRDSEVVRLRRLNEEVARLRKDRKSTRLNSSHVRISYAVFCLKKKIGWEMLQPTFDYTASRAYSPMRI